MGPPGWLQSEVAPLLAAIVKVNEQLAWCDAAVEHAARNDPTVALLRTARRIGPVTAASFRAVATVALARKLAGILFAMLRDGTPLDPGKQVGVHAPWLRWAGPGPRRRQDDDGTVRSPLARLHAHSCRLTGVAGQPAITGDGVVTGAIRKP
jgi:hypothetical protein